MPKVSIVSPTYNHEKYVAKTIQSLLTQTFQDFELIITDDASTDNNIEEILKFQDSRITLLRNESNQGITATSARCWQHAQGEYLLGLATDDVCEPNMLEILVNHLDRHPEVIAAFGLASFIDDDGGLISGGWTDIGVGQDRYTHLRQLFRLEHPFCSISGMYRCDVLRKLGYFPPYLRQANDMSHFIRLLFYGPMSILPDRILRYRWRANDGNVSSRTLENDSRLDFELFEILDLYREHITSVELLRKIFPEVDQHPWPLDEDLLIFHLAHVAISFSYPAHRLFGMHLLYQLFKNEATAKSLRERCRFTYTDFFHLAGLQPLVMNHSLWSKNNELQSEINSLQKLVAELNHELEIIKLVPSSTCSPVKKLLREFLHSCLNVLRNQD